MQVATIHFLQDAFEMSDNEVTRALRAPVEKIRTMFRAEERQKLRYGTSAMTLVETSYTAGTKRTATFSGQRYGVALDRG